MKNLVLKLTGYLFSEDRLSELENIIAFIKEDHRIEGRVYYIVVGGGNYPRVFIERLRRKGTKEYVLDKIGIAFSKLYARYVLNLLKPYVHPIVPSNVEEAILLDLRRRTNMVVGGFSPGFSTNAVSALIAANLGADALITMSRAGGLYDKDPSLHKDATLISQANIGTLEKILSSYKERAGFYPLLDKTAIKVIKRYRIKTYIIPPTLNALRGLLSGEKVGTEILV
ncbi:MAG: hypothetical protein QXH96_00405 [Candidatus Geothermarchaeota archaeon]